MSDIHETMMRRALVLARKGVGKTSPNPAVGCVIVKDGKIVGEGWHRKAGTPHAEVHALSAAGEMAKGSDLYVTLEPCSHHGKTPPCADAVVAAGVGRVFAGMVDPNPKVGGRGISILEQAGISTTVGILEAECRDLNRPFIKHITTGRPFVVLKLAMTLDGKIASASGDSKWITSEKSRAYAHRLRAEVDAVLVGADTVVADNPRLNVRLAKGNDPLRVVVDSRLRTPAEAAVFAPSNGGGTILATVVRDPGLHRKYVDAGAEILVCRENDGRVDLNDLLRQLGELKVQSLLVEGGGTLAGEFLRRRLIDKFVLFYAPVILGGEGIPSFAGEGAATIAAAPRLSGVVTRRIGCDIVVEGYPEESCLPV